MRAVAVVLMVLALAGCAGPQRGTFRPAGGVVPESSSPPGPTGDLRVVFASPRPADPVDAGVYDDFALMFRAYYSAIRLHDSAYADRVLDTERPVFAAALDRLARRHAVPDGTIRFFATRVTAVYGPGAEVQTCVDESHLTLRDERTGHVLPPDRSPRYTIRAGMRRGPDETWRLAVYETDHTSRSCQ